MWWSRRRLLVAAVTGAALASLGVGWAMGVGGSRDADLSAPSDYVTSRQHLEHGLSDADAVRSGTAWMDPGVLVAAKASAPEASNGRPGIRLDIEVKGASAADGGFLASTWQADLAQGVIAERLAGDSGNLADTISEVHIEFIDGTGARSEIPSGVGDLQPGQRFGDPAITDDQARAALTAAAEKFGVTVLEARILHPLDRAAYVVVELPDEHALDGKFEAFRQALLHDPKAFEGLYLEIRDPHGAPLARGSVAFRSGAGRIWQAPSYADRSGVAHG